MNGNVLLAGCVTAVVRVCPRTSGTRVLFFYSLVQSMPKKSEDGAHVRTFGESKYQAPENRLRATAPHAIPYHGTVMPFFTTLPFGPILWYLSFLRLFYCPKGFIHVEIHNISKVQMKHFL